MTEFLRKDPKVIVGNRNQVHQDTMVGIASGANVYVKIKVEEAEGKEEEYDKGLIYVNNDVQKHDSGKIIAERHSRKTLGPFRKRLSRYVGGKPLLSIHRARLSSLLMKLTKMYSWKEASGVLSILLKGTPRGYSLIEDERNFLVAMELHRQFKSTSHYQTKIRQLFEIRMDKLIWAKKCPNKKPSIQLELALFYISRGNIQEAHNITKSLVQGSSVIDPKVNLIHGLILYQLWYSSLPGEMQIKGFNNQLAFDTHNMPSNGCDETEMAESSNDHYAVYKKDSNISSRFVSESSVGNGKVFPGCWSDVKNKTYHDAPPAPLFYMEGSEANSVPGAPASVHMNMSIFFAHDRLDASLLPLKLKHSSIICEDFVHSHRRFINDYYEDGVKNLRLALHSSPPLFAALLPLVQILLLGDRVGEAFNELEEFSRYRDAVLVYRIKARLLECFCSSQASLISSCYEDVLRRDPTCSHSLERLIKMHKIGSYGSSPLLEMIALNLDATPGNANLWGELASCFLKLVMTMHGDYEDCNSTNERSIKDVPHKNIPKAFKERHSRESWKLRCRWWATHHFSRKAYMQDVRAGALKLLASKAACASHLYGPRCEFVMHVLSSLRKEDENDEITVLSQHMLNSMKLAHLLSDAIIL